MATHVLVPVDGSDPSTAALEFAVEEYPDAMVTALHVVNPIESIAAISTGDGTTYDEILDMHRDQAETLLEAARERAAEHGVDIETEYAVGDVVRSIMEFADGHGVDHIVIGSHGRTGVSRVVLGSVAEMVTRRAPVPVTVVR